MLERIDDVWTKGTHIVFRNYGKMNGSKGPQRKTNIYEVLPKGEPGSFRLMLGQIRWFGRWRKYCFFPSTDTVYEETCLRDISQFIEEETAAHRKAAASRKTKV